jgi:hypothetical protein
MMINKNVFLAFQDAIAINQPINQAKGWPFEDIPMFFCIMIYHDLETLIVLGYNIAITIYA